MSKVIPFPVKADSDLPKTNKEKRDKLLKVRKEYAAESVEIVVEQLFLSMSHLGFNPRSIDPEDHKDYFFLTEAITALMYRQIGAKHHLHKVIDQIILIDKPEGEKKNDMKGKKVKE